jgi:hypothetical protein
MEIDREIDRERAVRFSLLNFNSVDGVVVAYKNNAAL